MDRPALRRYQTLLYDSANWDNFRFRSGDIIVCAPVKSGTTWTQMICALLVHQSATLPVPLNILSPWLDRRRKSQADVVAELDSQPYRRIIKTHTPLDGIPFHSDVSYVFCGRDPRDVYFSLMDHLANTSAENLTSSRSLVGIPDGFESSHDVEDAFSVWMTCGEQPWMADGFPYGSVLSMTLSYWEQKHLENLHFVHYADLSNALESEMARLSACLNLAIDDCLWPELVEAATFESMKGKANAVAPGAHAHDWRSNSDFFRRGRIGEWQTRLSPANRELYEEVASRVLPPPAKTWLERGGPVG